MMTVPSAVGPLAVCCFGGAASRRLNPVCEIGSTPSGFESQRDRRTTTRMQPCITRSIEAIGTPSGLRGSHSERRILLTEIHSALVRSRAVPTHRVHVLATRQGFLSTCAPLSGCEPRRSRRWIRSASFGLPQGV